MTSLVDPRLDAPGSGSRSEAPTPNSYTPFTRAEASRISLSLDGLTGVGKGVRTNTDASRQTPSPGGEGWGEGENLVYLPL